MKSFLVIAIFAIFCIAVRGQFVSHAYNLVAAPALAFHAAPVVLPVHGNPALDTNTLAHPAVVENAALEAQLPEELKSMHYKNPAVAAGLAKESWFGNKEMPVGHRDADDVPRSEIFKIIERAGFNH